MEVIIKIHTDNSAFEDNAGAELARILENLAFTARANGRNLQWFHGMACRDINGNTVGSVWIKE